MCDIQFQKFQIFYHMALSLYINGFAMVGDLKLIKYNLNQGYRESTLLEKVLMWLLVAHIKLVIALYITNTP